MKLESEDIAAVSEPFREPELQTTDIGTIRNEIKDIMEDLNGDGQNIKTIP